AVLGHCLTLSVCRQARGSAERNGEPVVSTGFLAARLGVRCQGMPACCGAGRAVRPACFVITDARRLTQNATRGMMVTVARYPSTGVLRTTCRAARTTPTVVRPSSGA